jgi:hypothetical protein
MTQELKDERGAWDGDSQESRTAFRNYDTIAEPVSRKTPWQIWRDACAWQARAALNASETNQCDGCRTGAPVSERGNHLMPDGGYMGCTKDRYTSERQSTMALAKARSALYSIAKTYDDEELRTRALEAYEATFDAARAAQPPAAIVNAQEKRIVYTRPAPANKADDEEIIALAAKHHIASESPVFNQQIVRFAEALLERMTDEDNCMPEYQWAAARVRELKTATTPAEAALDRLAENAHELGLGYEPLTKAEPYQWRDTGPLETGDPK